MVFLSSVTKNIIEKQSHLCIGLDSDYERLPNIIKKEPSISQAIFRFNREIIDATAGIAIAFKMNLVFYACNGLEGLKGLILTNNYIKTRYPSIKIIADCKRSEMLRSAELTACELFDQFLFDAFTITPWFGFDTIEPYLKHPDKAIFVICHDSNPSAKEIQDVKLKNDKYLYEYVTKLVCDKWNKAGNLFIEAPLTYPSILKRIKHIANKKQFFLIAGLGAQRGKINDLKIFNKDRNFLVSASRSIIFASSRNNFAEEAYKSASQYRRQILSVLK